VQWLGRPFAYRGRYSMICQGTLPDILQPADFTGISSCDGRDMPTVTKPLRALPTLARSGDVAKSVGSEEPVITLMDALLYGP
jgi:hypothetical protein